ncbi:MAG: mechanosensitive ion channel family protein [Halobacteriales archaeon]|nr:mechanosensitive ion channel family protein [Halobacteriales archaeon]
MVSGVPDLTDVQPFDIDSTTVVGAFITLAAAYVLARAVTYALTRLSERSVKRRTMVKMFIPITRSVIYAAALYYVLGPLFDLTSGQLLAFSGVFGAVLGLGVKELFANIVAGIVLVFESPYRIGDKVEFGDYYGEVTDIGIRSTKLVTPDDSLVTVPNYLVFTNSVSNANDGSAEMMVVPEFHVSADTDLDRAVSIVRDGLKTSRYVRLSYDHGVYVRVEDRRGYRTLRGKAYVNDVRNEQAFRTDVTERVLAKFEEEGIESPDVSAALIDDSDGS